MLKIKKEPIYLSKLFLHFINNFIFINLRLKMEKIIYFSFFQWKKQLSVIPIFYFFETLLKIRPIIGFYLYIIKKKRKKKKIKIKPYYMTFKRRWQKAIYWLTRTLKMEREKQQLSFGIINELYSIVFFGKSLALKQKKRHYNTILLFKSSKNYKW